MRQGQVDDLVTHARDVLIPGFVGAVCGDGRVPRPAGGNQISAGFTVEGHDDPGFHRSVCVQRGRKIQSALKDHVHHTVDGSRVLEPAIEHRLGHDRGGRPIGDVIDGHRRLRIRRPPRAVGHPHHRSVPAVAGFGDHGQAIAGEELPDHISRQ